MTGKGQPLTVKARFHLQINICIKIPLLQSSRINKITIFRTMSRIIFRAVPVFGPDSGNYVMLIWTEREVHNASSSLYRVFFSRLRPISQYSGLISMLIHRRFNSLQATAVVQLPENGSRIRSDSWE